MRIPWKELQQTQEIHDQNYHRDVYNFSLIKQINHLVLHYCKYIGRAVEAIDTKAMTTEHLGFLLTETGIISLSAANALQVSLDQRVAQPLLEYTPKNLDQLYPLFIQAAIPTGKMAKALESLDHEENLPWKEYLDNGVIAIANTVQEVAGSLEYNLVAGIRERWAEIERKTRR